MAQLENEEITALFALTDGKGFSQFGVTLSDAVQPGNHLFVAQVTIGWHRIARLRIKISDFSIGRNGRSWQANDSQLDDSTQRQKETHPKYSDSHDAQNTTDRVQVVGSTEFKTDEAIGIIAGFRTDCIYTKEAKRWVAVLGPALNMSAFSAYHEFFWRFPANGARSCYDSQDNESIVNSFCCSL